MPSLKKWLKRNINQISVSGILIAQKSPFKNAMNPMREPSNFGMGDFNSLLSYLGRYRSLDVFWYDNGIATK